MYQSVMAKRQGSGSSGTGFAFALVTIKEILPDKNICLAEDKQSGVQYQLGLDKRGILAWPQTGDIWIIDRSLGHWALRSKITDTEAPVYEGIAARMADSTIHLVSLLEDLGLLQDQINYDDPLPVLTMSRNTLTPAVRTIIDVLSDQGLVDDQTTSATLPVDVWQTVALLNGFTGYISGTDDVTVRYKINYDSTVTVEGRATPPGSVSNGVTMFNIPSGYRPPIPKYQTTNVANGTAGTIVFGKDGLVGLYDFGATTPTRVLFHMRYSLV